MMLGSWAMMSDLLPLSLINIREDAMKNIRVDVNAALIG